MNAGGRPVTAGPAAPRQRLGASDCERLREGLVAQPVNTASSAALVPAGLAFVLWARSRGDLRQDLALGLGAGLALAGLGSVDYHGLQTPLAAWGHDWGIAVPVVVALHVDAATLAPDLDPRLGWAATAAALAATGVVLARHPAAGPAVAAVAAAAFLGAETAVRRRGLRPATPRARRLLAGALAATGVGVSAHALTRTGRPACRPDSLLQGHALWHLASAVAMLCWSAATLPAIPPAGRHGGTARDTP
jgi:hypothetical protein